MASRRGVAADRPPTLDARRCVGGDAPGVIIPGFPLSPIPGDPMPRFVLFAPLVALRGGAVMARNRQESPRMCRQVQENGHFPAKAAVRAAGTSPFDGTLPGS
jgi:hypothetical protein